MDTKQGRNKVASLATDSVVMALAIGVGLAMTALVQKNAANQRELDQSVRADTVTSFIDSLVSDQGAIRNCPND